MTHIALHVRDITACETFYTEFCGLKVVHERRAPEVESRVVWLAEPGRENEFIYVLISGGPGRDQAEKDYSHAGFAMESRAAVDAVAARAKAAGCLIWEAARGAVSGRLLLRCARSRRQCGRVQLWSTARTRCGADIMIMRFIDWLGEGVLKLLRLIFLNKAARRAIDGSRRRRQNRRRRSPKKQAKGERGKP